MNEPSLHQLEQEVEAARSRLARDLATLRSPATLSGFTNELKEQVVAVKADLIDKAQTAVQERVHDWIDTIKARAAENPAAVLAIGAGLAWRMAKHPPIATALVGVGLFSLLRGSAPARAGFADADYIEHAKVRLKEQSADMSAGLAAAATSAAASARDKIAEWGAVASSELQTQGSKLADAATATMSEAADQLGETWTSAGESAGRSIERVGRVAAEIRQTAGQQEVTDKLLLGAAGVAVAAALGIAVQRRVGETATAD